WDSSRWLGYGSHILQHVSCRPVLGILSTQEPQPCEIALSAQEKGFTHMRS
ncbi:Hypothetical predicted protein, partial [Marmota monax]